MGTMKSDYIKRKEAERAKRRLAWEKDLRTKATKATWKQVEFLEFLMADLELDGETRILWCRRHAPLWAKDDIFGPQDLTVQEASKLVKSLIVERDGQ